MAALTTTDCPDLRLIARGKVRDLYDVDDKTLLFVATDRISAFDVVMKNGIPGKGKILTQISDFWFNKLHSVVPHHLITCKVAEMPASVQKYASQIEGRAMLVKKLKILPVEAIVRGYISGSAWVEYTKKGTMCDMPLPKGLKESEEFPEAVFTPSTKAEMGEHDENINPDKLPALIGDKLAKQLEEVALKLYTTARNYAREKGIIIADTKFEFGVDENDNLVLADEVLTPDSSRFWPADRYKVGQGQPSYDKQYLRDYLTSINFDKATGVELPAAVIDNTMQKYIEAFTILTGKTPVL
ncbi:Bifunctional purine biosynthetic protein ade1 [Geranomyces variabilis]|uniref:Phosphoribosylaminoimidazole-succinocarboxamide synthase n=1 Tax=Geranomyces variabilis TaxID=109894 RepID=A0AAD5TQ34_9FUNG|nr:Bifunctional purine biosynthetic protein ade1 [Geranomyces variabilis]